MALLNGNMSTHDLDCRPSKCDCIKGTILETDIDHDGALPAHLHALGEFVPPYWGCLFILSVDAQVGSQAARSRSSGRILQVMGHHASAQLDHRDAVFGGRGARANIVEAADEALLPVGVEEVVGLELHAADVDGGEQLQRRQLDGDKGHALDEAEDGRRELQLADGLIALEVDGGLEAGILGEADGVQVDVVRHGNGHRVRAGLGDGDGAGLCDDLGDALGQQRDGAADGRVAGEGDLGGGEEDVDLARGVCGGVGDVVDEDCLGEVEFAGNGLFLVLGWFGARCGDGDDGEGVAAEAGAGEDVEGYVGKLHGCALVCIRDKRECGWVGGEVIERVDGEEVLSLEIERIERGGE